MPATTGAASTPVCALNRPRPYLNARPLRHTAPKRRAPRWLRAGAARAKRADGPLANACAHARICAPAPKTPHVRTPSGSCGWSRGPTTAPRALGSSGLSGTPCSWPGVVGGWPRSSRTRGCSERTSALRAPAGTLGHRVKRARGLSRQRGGWPVCEHVACFLTSARCNGVRLLMRMIAGGAGLTDALGVAARAQDAGAETVRACDTLLVAC